MTPEDTKEEVQEVVTPEATPEVVATPAEEGKPVGMATIVDGDTMGDQFPTHEAEL